jgi:hypothetical protein
MGKLSNMLRKIKVLLFYAVIIDGYDHYFGKNDPKAPFIGLLIASILFIAGFIVTKKIKSFLQRNRDLPIK